MIKLTNTQKDCMDHFRDPVLWGRRRFISRSLEIKETNRSGRFSTWERSAWSCLICRGRRCTTTRGCRDCLYEAAKEFKLKTTPDEILYHMGTNKIHLYQFLIARERGKQIDIEDFEKIKDPETYDFAKKVFDRYQEIMLGYYRKKCREVPGAADTFRWCHKHGIKVATDTGFHRVITNALMDGLGWGEGGSGGYRRGRGTHPGGDRPPCTLHDLPCHDTIEHSECPMR